MNLDLAQLGQGRIWLDDVAEAELPLDQALRLDHDPPERGWFLLDEAAIEVALSRPLPSSPSAGSPAGTGSCYGLLGCAFERANTGGTTLVVPIGESPAAPHLAEALAASDGSPRCALDEAQAQAVLDGARSELVRRGPTPSGTLTFHVAATTAASADPLLFRRLGALCVRLLDVPIEADEDHCATLVQAALTSHTA